MGRETSPQVSLEQSWKGHRIALGVMALTLALGISACGLVRGGDEAQSIEGAQIGSDADEATESDDDVDAGDTGNDVDSDNSDLVIDASFEDGSCDPSIPQDLAPVCGTVAVPMDWATGEGSVELAVVVFPSTSDNPAEDPTVYLEGGPGGHALETLPFSAETLVAPLLERGDVIVFDQRGAGLSTPRLSCDEATEATREAEDSPVVDDEEFEAKYFAALEACRDRFLADGIDLTDFNSINNAHDVEAIRVALEYDQWNLFGISYGTKLGLEVMRQHPEGVRSVVLDSVYPPEVDSVADNPQTFVDSYQRVVDACAAEPTCAAEGPLDERFAKVVGELQAKPKQITVTDLLTGQADEIYMSGDTIVGVVTQALYSPSWFTDLPELVTDLENGGTAVAAQFLSQQRTLEAFFSDGMFYAIACHEEISFADPATTVDPPDPFGLRDTFNLASNTGSNAFETCAAFENGMAPDSSNSPVESDLPTLLLAGQFDPVTPVSWAEDAAEDLSNSYLAVGDFESHGVTGNECGMSVALSFLDDPSTEPDSSCFADGSVEFLKSAAAPIELEEASYTVNPWGVNVTTVRPKGWTVGPLGGDQYRQKSFLDSTQLLQVAGDETLGMAIEQFIQAIPDLTLSEAEVFDGDSRIGPIEAVDLPGSWKRRSGTAPNLAIEWFETTLDGNQVYVILVSSSAEQDALMERVLLPAMKAIEVS